MSTTVATVAYASRREMILARLAAYLELSKPRIAALVLVVVAVSAMVGSPTDAHSWSWAHALLGTALIAASASTFNQLIERRSDALMDRTIDRPLPSARLSTSEAVTFGIATMVLGVLDLAVLANLTAALLGLLTWLVYVAIYTPLKPQTTANTSIGAIAGALPVLIGWAAAGASFSLSDSPFPGGLRVAALFLIVYLWQFPHFMAIAWIYRRQYAAAALKMLTVVDPSGRRAGAQAVLGALALLPVSLLPTLQTAGPLYQAGALGLGVAYLVAAIVFCWRRDELSARRLLQTSLIYLPVLLALLVLSPLA